ncbi:ABC transporter ATP-binding protein [Bdellovibrio reynosensis]|uniref:ABC transporter ATP-binding protein n=1 Tax=Bdellovibrio reynosensis TaxID=2835041 RepID=A0ABY4CB78_9BACT|nr:ABC transporter ATP-binding protein [Bdellovibrio reynosensis]UOF02103.1 ABC transporter ATP-binding protein [Bdellovibrio reynosensis]
MLISIDAKNISKKMGPNQALSNLNMSFKAHEIHGIIGPEGAGKTTLLRLIIGLLNSDAGEIYYQEQNRLVDFSNMREGIAYMPQTQSLYPELSIHEHLEFFKTLYQLTDEQYFARRKKLLAMARLEDVTDRLASQLSGGMYKKLGLICALLSAPSVLLLDEPTNGVDPLSRRDFWKLLYELRENEEILIIVTTSYMDEALKCQTVHLLFDGKTLIEGNPLEILASKNCESFDQVFLQYDDTVDSL